MTDLPLRPFRTTRLLWPRLLLAGLVTVLVFGACGSGQLLRRTRRSPPLEVRYRIRRDHILYVFGLGRDTIAAELRYRGQPLPPPAGGCPSAQADGFHFRNARRLAGPEPRWLLTNRCGTTATLFLLRVPASGPEFYRIGPSNYRAYRTLRTRLIMPQLDQGQTSYLVETDTLGWLFNWQTLRSEAVRLPELADVRWQPWAPDVAYTASPDQRVLARIYRPDMPAAGTAGAGPPTAESRLIIDQYDLDRHTFHRLTATGVYPPVPQLRHLTEWTQTAGRWQLLPRR